MSWTVKMAIQLGFGAQCALAALVLSAAVHDAELVGALPEWQSMTLAAMLSSLLGIGAWFQDERGQAGGRRKAGA